MKRKRIILGVMVVVMLIMIATTVAGDFQPIKSQKSRLWECHDLTACEGPDICSASEVHPSSGDFCKADCYDFGVKMDELECIDTL